MLSVLIYFTILILIVATKKKLKDFHSFSKGNILLNGNYFIFIASIFVSSIGGGTIVGLAEKIHSGALFYAYAAIFAIIFDILIAKYVVPRLSTKFYKLHSVGEILSTCYGTHGKLIGGVISCITSLGLVSAQLNVSGKVFEYILNIEYIYGIMLSLAIVLIYTNLGGITSILTSNKMQFLAIIISVPLLTLFSIQNFDTKSAKNILLDSIIHDYHLILLAVLNFLSMNLFPNFIQRVTLTNNYKLVQKSIYIKSIIYFLLLLMIILNSITSIIFFPDTESKFALPSIIEKLIPFYLQPLIIIGIFASITSTIDSDINISAISLVKDVLQPCAPKIFNNKNLILCTRCVTCFLGIISANIALMFEYVIDLVIFTAGFWGSVILPGLIFLIFDIVINKRFFLTFSIIGLTTFLIYEILFINNILRGVALGFFTNFTCFSIFVLIQKYYKKL